MTLNINVIKQSDYLEIAVTGSYNMVAAMNKFSHILDVCRLTAVAPAAHSWAENLVIWVAVANTAKRRPGPLMKRSSGF